MKVRLGTSNYFRKGTLYAAGTVIDFPDDEIPSVTWTKVDDKTPVDRTIEMHPNGTADKRKKRSGDEDDDNPATRPLPNTPPTAKSVAGTIPNTGRAPGEQPALSPEDARKRSEEKARARAALSAPVSVSPKEADAAIKATEDRQHKAAEAREKEQKSFLDATQPKQEHGEQHRAPAKKEH